ncbi:MAG: threonine-phosphate decarboxylase, partial [Pseudomonas sp.]|nr:threonine-phosphate decarboxylase [Pseudomonas sp.]
VGPWAVSGPARELGQVCLRDSAGHTYQRQRCEDASQRLFRLLEQYGLRPQGGCALFQWLISDHAEQLHEFMAQRGILLRLFVHDSSLRFGLPGTDADWLRLEQALTAWKQTS